MRTDSIKNEDKGKMLANASETEKMIFRELQKMGFSAAYVGSIYAMEVIGQLVMTSFAAEISKSKYLRIIDTIAKRHEMTAGMLNSRIGWTIDKVMQDGNVEYIHEICGKDFEEICGYGSKRTKHFLLSVAVQIKNNMEKKPDESVETFRRVVIESVETATLPVLEMIYGIAKFNALTENEVLA